MGEMPQPIVATAYLSAWQALNPAFAHAADALRQAGVDFLLGDRGFNPHVPHIGKSRPDGFLWARALEVLQATQ